MDVDLGLIFSVQRLVSLERNKYLISYSVAFKNCVSGCSFHYFSLDVVYHKPVFLCLYAKL